jgi:hypothetical protein
LPLTPGTRIGPYEILSLLGAGGIGEVYRAQDARLDRQVAIKVLAAPAAAGWTAVPDDRLARFEREARVLAALSHPNIVAIFDTGVHEDRLFVVMELLAGRTLREAIGGMRLQKAIAVGIQIARGLGAAHDKGIVHRDLKPENVFLADDGQVKILDFGLAHRHLPPLTDNANTTVATEPGVLMGTVGYMAPEQVRGQTVDARADVFALGAVIYEMVSGVRAFQRSSAADTLVAILSDDPPPIATTQSGVPPAIERITRHCLEKDPADRFQSAHDLAFALEALGGASIDAAERPVPARAPRRRWIWPAALLATAALGVAAGIAVDRARRAEPGNLTFEAKTWDRQWITNARFGPDGRTLVFSAATSGMVPSLYVIPPNAIVPRPIGPPGTHLLAVSSKGEIAAITGARLAHHRIFTGTLSRLTMEGAARPWMQDVSEADFGPDGSTLAVIRSVDGKWQLEYPAGTVLYTASTGYVSDLRVSPDGTRVAFFDHPGSGDNRGTLKVVGTDTRVSVLSGEYPGVEGLAWAADAAAVVFTPGDWSQYNVVVASLDGSPPRQVAAGPGYAVVSDLAANGRLLLTKGSLRYDLRGQVPGEATEREFPWLDGSLFPGLSHDGRRLVFEDVSQSAGADYQVALRDIATGSVARLGPGTSLGLSPDSAWAAAQIPSTLQMVLYPTGVGEPVRLDSGPIDLTRIAVEWFSNSRRLMYCGRGRGAPARCYAQDVTGGPPAVVTPDDVTSAVLAGDDRTLLMQRGDQFQVMTIGGTPIDAKGFAAADRLLTWNSEGRAVVVADNSTMPAGIDLVDPWSGSRRRLRVLAPPDRTGVVRIDHVHWLPDGRGYVYSYQREEGQLFIVSGWRR